MGKKRIKSWNWADEPQRYRPIKCGVCDMCYFDTLIRKCVHDGPFRGYRNPDGIVENLEEWRAKGGGLEKRAGIEPA